MTDRNELRRLAEACLAHLDSGPLWVEWEENGPGPVEFLVLLDEIVALEIAESVAQNVLEDWKARALSAETERDQLRAVLGKIANHNPAVTHGWAKWVREMARSALRVNGESQ